VKKDTDLKVIAVELKLNPNESNWKKFEKAIKNSNAMYYKITYAKLNNKEDIRKAYAEIFNKNKKLITTIPIFKKEGKKIEGATIRLKDLVSINKW